jgi:hypothetical protein
MSQPEQYRYVFSSAVPFDGVVDALLLARWGAEALHGETPARLEAAHNFDRDNRACEIDAATPVGRDLNRLFAGYVTREFGADGFKVERVGASHAEVPA